MQSNATQVTRETQANKQHFSALEQYCLAATSGILLSLAFLDADYYVFTWFAFVPLLMAISQVSLWRTYSLGLTTGLAFSISAAYWMVDFLILSKAYSIGPAMLWAFVFWFYCAQLSAFLVLSFNWLTRRSRVHEFILFPLLVVAFYSAFPMLFTVRLGESQSQFLSAIQSVELTGVHGLDAVIALVNIMLFCLVSRFMGKQSTASIKSYLLAGFIITAWFAYGIFTQQSWAQQLPTAQTIKMGLVQPNEQPSLEKAKPYPGFSNAYPPEMAMTERLSAAGAEVVIWPEAKYKAYLDDEHVRRAYQKQLEALNVSLVFQDIAHKAVHEPSSDSLKFNTALMLNDQGELVGQYQKMKRIAFGEYVPLVSDIPVLKAGVESFLGKFLNEMAAGQSHQVFAGASANIIPLICYEVMFPEFVAKSVAHAQAETQSAKQPASMLVGLSSNAWFGNTRQPYQHVNASILRAVENRMSLVHVVNNGPSIVAIPTGEVMFISPPRHAGGYIVDVPYLHSRPSIYNRFPNLFLYSVYLVLLLVVLRSSKEVRKSY